MKALKFIGATLLGLIGLVVVLYVIGMGVNWRDQPPSAAALELKKILRDRPPVADADNAFVFALGFSVPAAADPQAAGVLRTTWIETLKRDPKATDADPVKDDVEFSKAISPRMEAFKESCGDAHSAKCRDTFVAAFHQPRTALEDLQLARYRTLLQRPVWREEVVTRVEVPIARFGDILGGQRLMFVDIGARAKTAAQSEIFAELRADLTFWREVMKSSDYLISKMVAVAAIRNHFFFGNLVLREMPAAQAGVIDVWTEPFGAAELSLRRTMAGELSFAEGVMLKWKSGTELQPFLEPEGEGLTLMGRIGSSLARPYYQHQDQMNYYSALYLDLATRFDAPLGQYPEIAADLETTGPGEFSFHIYNAVGHVFRSIADTSTIYASYPLRIGSVEGMRRAALLTAQLRDRRVAPKDVAEELKSAELRGPFENESFLWSEEEQAVVYEGPDAERSRYRHPYFL